MIWAYIILTIIIGFFIYKSKENQFEIEGYGEDYNWNPSKSQYENVKVKNYNDWVSRPIFWYITTMTLFWPITIPGLVLLKVLTLIYNKLNINKFKIFKKDEEYRKNYENAFNDKHNSIND